MDDLNSTIGAILNDPNKIAQLRTVAESLGINTGNGPAQNPAGANTTNSTDSQPNEHTPPVQTEQTQPDQNPDSGGQQTVAPSGPTNTNQSSGIDPAAIASILQNFQNASGGNSGTTGNDATGASSENSTIDPSMVAKLSQVMSTFNSNDKNVELMRSLKPHFSATRASRVDDAIRIMQLLRAWPTVKDSGLLGKFTNLFGGGRR